jgi:flavin reductase (DIM6/NTAB) family NADH-FMN oxidoreductase RutF
MVVPRPISLISTVSSGGNLNLAPYSLFNVVCYTPAMVFLTPMRKNSGAKKDTLINIENTREFVINLVTEDIAQQMSQTSAAYPPEVDEFKISGLTPVASDLVKPPRVAESPFNLECRLAQIMPLGDPSNITADMILGTVLRVHIADQFYAAGSIDSASAHLIGRMGLGYYTRTRDLFRMGEN